MASAASLTGRGPATSIDEKKKERERQRRDEQRLRCEELIRGSDCAAADSAKVLGKSLAKHPELLKHTDRLGRTQLHSAAAHGPYDCAELLVARVEPRARRRAATKPALGTRPPGKFRVGISLERDARGWGVPTQSPLTSAAAAARRGPRW